ncbi:MAG TPA: threonylcarbamoyl-AMP synthase [Planctomycetaceae bacterium]|nr:threonylcarbamoyl-AMP synthase [Planctomycetaceae bacterium]
MPPAIIDVRNADDIRDVVHRAVQALVEGQLIVVPTETVYGVAALALDEAAVGRLCEVKCRKGGHPLPVAIRSSDEALDYAPDMSPLFRRLARRCWPGPVTLVVDNSHPESLVTRLPRRVRQAVSPHQTVGLRVPGHPVVLDILQMVAGPLVLSSANRGGEPEAVNAQEALAAIGDEVALVLDDGPCRFGQPSSVVRVRQTDFEVLRAGVVPERTLKRLSSLMLLFVCTGNTCRSPMAERLARDLLAKRLKCSIEELEDRGVVVHSAGVAAGMGGKASREAVQVMAEAGLDLTGHETHPLTEPLVRHADAIYAMTQSHRETIIAQWPDAADRTHVLCRDGSDVLDPIGGTTQRYQHCADQIRVELESRLGDLTI